MCVSVPRYQSRGCYPHVLTCALKSEIASSVRVQTCLVRFKSNFIKCANVNSSKCFLVHLKTVYQQITNTDIKRLDDGPMWNI